MRISILGFSCSGKTSFSNWLGKLSKLPVFHLDDYYWESPWVKNENFNVMDVVKCENWIIDGTYYHEFFEERILNSNYIIYLDCNIFVRIFRMIKRHIKYLLNPIGKNPISQKINGKFLLLTIRKIYTVQPQILHMLEKIECNGRSFIYVKGKHQINKLMEQIKNEDILKLFNASED